MKYRIPHYLLCSLLGLSLLSCHKNSKEAPTPKPAAYEVHMLVEVRNFDNADGLLTIQGATFPHPGYSSNYISVLGLGPFTVGNFDFKLFPTDANQTTAPEPKLPAGHTFVVRLAYRIERNVLAQGGYRNMSFRAKVLKRDAANPAAPEETVAELDLPVPTTPGQPNEEVFIAKNLTL